MEFNPQTQPHREPPMRPNWALSATGWLQWHGISFKEPNSTGVDEALPISLSFLLLMRIHLPFVSLRGRVVQTLVLCNVANNCSNAHKMLKKCVANPRSFSPSGTESFFKNLLKCSNVERWLGERSDALRFASCRSLWTIMYCEAGAGLQRLSEAK